MPMSELERQTILNAIAQLNGDKLKAARMLGIGKTTLYRKLEGVFIALIVITHFDGDGRTSGRLAAILN